MKYKNSNFYTIRNLIKISQLPKILDDFIIEQKIIDNFEINSFSSLSNIQDNSVLFLDQNNFLEINNNKIFIITDNSKLIKNKFLKNYILVKNLNKCFNILANYLFAHDDSPEIDHDFKFKYNSYISSFANIHSSSIIQNGCTIGRGVIIGKNCLIKSNVVIKNTIIGDNVTISDNCTIGSTGFGFDATNPGAKEIYPHLGFVKISDNVYVGSNCCIDRGKLDITFIGKNCMFDNFIHIAHNVYIGNNVCIAAQTGVSGSTIIGNNVMIGGQTGIAGHIKIGDNVVIAAKSGVTKNISDNQRVAGFPAMDLIKWKRKIINEKRNRH